MNRRTLLVTLGGAVALSGCSSLDLGGSNDTGDSDDGSDDGDGGDGDGDGSDGDDNDGDGNDGDGSDGGDGMVGDGMVGDGTSTSGDTTAAPTPTPSGDGTSTGSGNGTAGPQASIRTPTGDESHDWGGIASQEEVDPFDGPDDVPTAFGWSRVSTTNTMNFSYGAMAGESDPVEEGTVYLLFVVQDRVRDVLVWETPIEHGESFTVGPEDSAYPMDVTNLSNVVIAWDDGSDVWVVDSNADLLDG